MIRGDKRSAALAAINAALVVARHLSMDAGEAARIPGYLDAMEHLPRLMADPRDTTAEFRAALADLARMNPSFALALHRFDTVSTYDW